MKELSWFIYFFCVESKYPIYCTCDWKYFII